MNAKQSSIGTVMACALLVLIVGVNAAAARTNARDELYRDARLDSHPSTVVAVLPAVAIAGNENAERQVERNWVALYSESSTLWMPAAQVRERLAQASCGSGDLAREAAAQIWRRGEVDPELAGRLARVLGVDAVMSLRIDRWEIVDGGRAAVEMTAVLTHADGTRLWSISGLAGYGVPVASGEQNFNMDMSWIRKRDLEPNNASHNLGRALYTLLARWAWLLPAGPLYADAGAADVMAQNQSE